MWPELTKVVAGVVVANSVVGGYDYVRVGCDGVNG